MAAQAACCDRAMGQRASIRIMSEGRFLDSYRISHESRKSEPITLLKLSCFFNLSQLFLYRFFLTVTVFVECENAVC
jgi:hypothetical protein